MPFLIAISGGPDIAVEDSVVVGRDPDCDAWLDSHRVSRWHCILTRKGSDVVVRDLGSTNGIWVNGRRVSSARLKAGDEMSIAHIRYRLESVPGYYQRLVDFPDDSESSSPFVLHSPPISGENS
jgi:predicted component of type VI protein secretion system